MHNGLRGSQQWAGALPGSERIAARHATPFWHGGLLPSGVPMHATGTRSLCSRVRLAWAESRKVRICWASCLGCWNTTPCGQAGGNAPAAVIARVSGTQKHAMRADPIEVRPAGPAGAGRARCKTSAHGKGHQPGTAALHVLTCPASGTVMSQLSGTAAAALLWVAMGMMASLDPLRRQKERAGCH